MFKHNHYVRFLSILLSTAFASTLSASPLNKSALVGNIEGDVNVEQGNLRYTVPLSTPTGVNGVEPSLSVTYKQGGGNGPLGLGFNLQGLSSLTRCSATKEIDGADKIVSYSLDDQYCMDGQRLVLVSGSSGVDGATYKTINGGNSKVVVASSDGYGPRSWDVYTEGGHIVHYGTTTDSRVLGRDDIVRAWNVSMMEDRFTNKVSYEYINTGLTSHIKEIKYNNHKVLFNYSNGRSDRQVVYRYGNRYVIDTLLDSISIYSNQVLRSSYKLTFEESASRSGVRLSQMRYCSADNSCVNPLVFKYADLPSSNGSITPLRPTETEFYDEEEKINWNKKLVEIAASDEEIKAKNGELVLNSTDHNQIYPISISDRVNSYASGDVNNDGLVDFCFASTSASENGLQCALSKGQGHFEDATVWGSDLSASFRTNENLANLMLLDLNNDSWTDYCVTQGNSGLYCALNNKRGSFGALQKKSPIKEDDRYSLVDVNHDEYIDICVFTNSNSSCYLNNKQGFSNSPTNLNTIKWAVKKNDTNIPAPQLTDINGDGSLDICGIYSNGRFACQYGQANTNGEMPSFSSIEYVSGNIIGANKEATKSFTGSFRYADLNADGLLEVCYLSGDDYVCHTNTGDGFSSAFVAKSSVTLTEEDYLHLLDRNNDNQVDLCIARVGLTEAEGETALSCAIQNEMQFGDFEHFGSLFPKPIKYEETRKVYGNWVRKVFGLSTRIHIISLGMSYGPLKQVGDINGDGFGDTCYVSTETINCITPNYEPLARLVGVTNSYGVDSSFEYQPLLSGLYTSETHNDVNVNEVLQDRLVISAISSDNGAGGETAITYRYQGYQAHKDDGGLGFRVIEKKNLTTGVRTRAEYAQTKELRGKVLKSTQYLGSKLLKKSEVTYKVQTSNEHEAIERVLLLAQKDSSFGYESGTALVKETKSSGFNTYGKPSKVVATVTNEATGNVKTTTTTTGYWHNNAKWLINKPKTITVKHQLTGAPTRSRHTSLDYYGTTGALRTETFEPGTTNALITHHTYDANGNKNTVTVEANGKKRVTRTQYDRYGRVTKNINALGHQETFTYDTKCNAVNAQTGPNGLTTRMEYDKLCRLVKTTAPDGQATTVLTQWTSAGEADAGIDFQGLGVPVGDRSVYKTTTQTSTGAWKTTYFDSLGREVRSKNIGQETRYQGVSQRRSILVDRVYNARGALLAATLPYYEGRFPGDISKWLRYTYDELGRVVKVSQPVEDGATREITTEYNDFRTTETRPDGSQKTSETDVTDKLVSVEENGITVTYSYDAIGNLLTTDTDGYVITLGYDSIGKNKIAMNDPSMGKWTYQYNGFGELVKQIDSKKQFSSMTYDVLGRMISRNDNNKDTTHWSYDNQWKGALDYQQNNNSRTEHSYDRYGRISANKQTINGESVTKTFEYDQYGRLIGLNYPQMSLQNTYDSTGKLRNVSVPKSDLWSYEYIQMEEKLKETIKYIGELQGQAKDYEDKVHELTLRSETYRKKAEYYFSVEKRYDGYAAKYQAYSDKYEGIADRYQGYANQYRAKARYYYRYLGNMVLKLQKVKNGKAYYAKSWCTKKDWKGRCKRSSSRSVTLPQWMVKQRVYQCTYGYKGGSKTCGYKTVTRSSVSPTKLYNQRADYYQGVATRYQGYSDRYQKYANYYKSVADRYARYGKNSLAVSKQLAADASDASNKLEKIMDELEHQKNVATALQEQIAAYQADDTLWHLWTVTSRDASGRLEGELFGNGINTKREFDAYTGDLLRIKTGVARKLIRDIRYTYNDRNSVTTRNDGIKNISESFTYDGLDRLTSWNYNNPTGANHARSYRYDTAGNMVSKTGAGSMIYDAKNRLTSRRLPSGAVSKYTYDTNGNMLKGDGRTYQWTSFNKVSSLFTAKGSTHYQYNGNQNRVKKEHNGVVTYYFGKDYEVVIETNKEGKRVRRMRHHIFAGNELVATHEKTLVEGEKREDKTAYVHRDALGSVDTVTDEAGKIVQQQRYTPFGEDLDVIDANNQYRKDEIRGYTGHENVGQTGLINMNARLYDPVIGRFIQADTMIPEPGNVQSYNRYVYVFNNPMKYTDPDGHSPLLFLIGLGSYLFSMTTDDPFLQKLTGLVGMALMGANMPAGFTAIQNGATLGFISGTAQGGFEEGFKQGIIGGLSAGLTGGVADELGHGFTTQSVIGQMIVGGVISEIRGGKFAHGAVASLAGKVGGKVSTSYFGAMNTGTQSDLYGRTMVSMMFGGLGSQAAGGDFMDGAMRGLFVHLFNDGEDMRRGNIAHGLLQEWLMVRDQGEWRAEERVRSLRNKSGSGRLDILHVATNGAFEIKPNNPSGHSGGAAQLMDYLAANPGLTPGNNAFVFRGVDAIVLFGTTPIGNHYRFRYTSGSVPGLIVYDHSLERNWFSWGVRALLPFLKFRMPKAPSPAPVPAY